MLAALTGAVTASGLGIAGTIIGAAFMSLASTVGAAVYKHYITRSNERLRAAAGFAPSHSAVASAVARHDAQPEPAQPDQTQPDQTRPGPASPDQTQRYPVRELGAPPEPAHGYVSPDGTETQIMPAQFPNGDLASARTQTFAWDQPPDQRGPADTVRSAPADLGGDVPTARLRAPGDPGRPDQASMAGPAPDTGHRWAWTRRRWVMAAAMALGVFVVAMGAITVFEVLVGKPLDAVVWHQHSSGTTLGGLVGHHPRPSTSPSPSHSPGSSHSPRPSHTPSSSPSPTTSSPTPTPSGSPSPGSSATPSGNASSPAAANSSPPAARTASPGASAASP